MPSAEELQEFGLEVEEEHHALVSSTSSATTPSRHRTHQPINQSHLSLNTPSKEQRSLLVSSTNTRTNSKFLKPGILKWAVLVLALAIAVFLHLGRESEETEIIEEWNMEDVAECVDDPDFTLMVKEEKSCATYVAHLDAGPHREGRCRRPIGIPDETQFQKLLQHYCRKSCGLCDFKDPLEANESDGEIRKEAGEIAVEIGEAELEKQTKEAMEDHEIDEMIEMGLDKEEVEKEPVKVEKDDEGDGDETKEDGTASEGEEKEQDNGSREEDKDAAASGDGKEGSEVAEKEDDSAEDSGKDNESKEEERAASADKEGDGDAAPVHEAKSAASEDGPSGKEDASEDKATKRAASPDEEKKESAGSADEEKESAAPVHEAKSASEDEPSTGSADEKAASGDEAGDDSANDKAKKIADAVKSIEESATATTDGRENDKEPSTTDGKPKSSGGTLTLERIKDTRNAAQSLIDELDKYYNGEDQAKKMMLDSWLSPWNFDDPSGPARERANKLVDTMARALVTEDQSEFIIGTIGSSVAAGHDNCHYDSYESQLERTLGPVWEAAGMKLTCQNAGEGGGCGDDHKNQVYCIKQNVSPNVDIVHYSWTYFEAPGWDDKYVARESLVRWTQMLPRQPPVHVLNVGEPNIEKQEYELADHYASYGYSAFYLRQGHVNGGYDYKADAANDIDRYAWGHVGDGYHEITRYGREETNPDRRESLGVVFRNWHPGPLAFEFASDAFSYVYAKAMVVALRLLEERLDKGEDPREVWDASKRKILLKKSLPDPKHCDPRYCVVDEAPGCLSYEKPTYGHWGPRVEDPNDSLNPHKGELQKWDVWHEDLDFWHMVGKQDTAIFQDRDDKEICRHLDNCGGISATSADNGMVVFRLPKMEVGLVAICGCCGKEVGDDMFLQNPYIEIKYNGVVLDRSTWDLFPTKKCARLLPKFPTGAAAMTPTGHAYLSVKALDGLNKPVRISHVITL